MNSLFTFLGDLYGQLAHLNAFVYYVTASFAVAVCWFIREIVGTSGLALASAPVLMGTGLAAHIAADRAMVQFVSEKDTNVALTSAIGVLAGLMLVVIGKALLMVWKEHRVRSTKLVAAARLTQ